MTVPSTDAQGRMSRLACAAGVLGGPLVCSLQHKQRLHKHVRGRLPHKLPHKIFQAFQAAALRASPLSVAFWHDAAFLCFALSVLKIPAHSRGMTISPQAALYYGLCCALSGQNK